MIRHPTRPTLFPYTTLFRSHTKLVSLHTPQNPAESISRSDLRSEKIREQIPDLRLQPALRSDRLAGQTCARSAEEFGTQSGRSEEHTSELQSHSDLVCRLLL